MPSGPNAEGETAPLWVRRLPTVTGTAVVVIGAMILLLWLVPEHRDLWLLAELPLMKANTAIACVAAGLALALRTPRAVSTLACVPILVGATTLTQWMGGFSLGIDELFAKDATGDAQPGRPSPQVAGALLLFGLARLRLPAQADRVSRLVTAVYAAVVVVLEIGFLFQAPELTSVSRISGMTAGSAVCLLLLLAGLLATHADRPPLRYLLDDGMAGMLTRRLLPAAILLPIVLGMLRYAGQVRGWYGLNLGVALFATSMVISLAVLVSITAATVHRLEGERSLITDQLRLAEQRARWLAERDVLTTVWNRRWFEAELAGHLHSAERAEGAVMMIDVDEFKTVNDTAGHEAGDAVLVAVARTVAERLGDRGSLSRIGGDEFAVILRNGDRHEAESVARSLVDAVRALSGATEGLPPTTVSIGVAAFADLPVGGPEGHSSIKTALRSADEALYAAKHSGRDTHAVYPPAPVRPT